MTGLQYAKRPGSGPAQSMAHRTRRLDERVRRDFEARFGHDFGNVRIHQAPENESVARTLGARAYTIGEDIVFREGEYAPGSATGRRLLAHELAHVVQQTHGAGSRREKPEAEADRAADAAVSSGRMPALSGAGFGVQMQGGGQQSDDERKKQEAAAAPAQAQQPTTQQAGATPTEQQPQGEQQAVEAAAAKLSRDLDPATALPLLQRNNPMLGAQNQYQLRPDIMNMPGVPPPRKLVEPGAGPTPARQGTPGDVLNAVMKTQLGEIRTLALNRLRSDWSRLSTGEKVVVTTSLVTLGAGALSPLAIPSTREKAGAMFPYSALQGANIPTFVVPGLSFNFQASGPSKSVGLVLDLTQYLPVLK